MRTTLDLDKPVLDGLKDLQKTERRSLGKLASQLLAEALAHRQNDRAAPAALRWMARPMGARIDLADKESLRRLLDQP